MKLMSDKYPASAASYDPAMTFDEIGRRLGISKQAAYFLFVSGLRKIRRSPTLRLKLLELYEEKEATRRPPVVMPW